MQRPWGRNMPDLFKGEKAATVVGAGGVRSNDVRQGGKRQIMKLLEGVWSLF